MKKTNPAAIDDDMVAEYLAVNGDFFARRPDSLTDLNLQASGDDDKQQQSQGVVPLVERQVSALRRRNTDLRTRMAALIANAKDNDRIFAATRTFTLALMDVDDFAAFNRALAQRLVAGFQLDHAACLLRGSVPGELEHIVGILGKAPLAHLFDYAEPLCGTYRAEEYGRLFRGVELDGPGSVALVPLGNRDDDVPATLALGSKDPSRFSADMGTVFLAYLGEVVSRTLARIERSRPS